MERLVAESFGKRRGVMCNSGSSALYLAVELLDLEPGDEIITSSVTFSTDIAPMIRAGVVPVFVDVEPDTYQIDVAADRGARSARARGRSSRPTSSATARLGRDPRDRRPSRPEGRGGLVRLPRRDAAGHAHGHPQRHLAHELRARRTSSPRRAPAACSASTTTTCSTGRCCCGAGVVAASRSCSARRRGTTALLLRHRRPSSTTTCSSSTRWAGTSSRRRSRPPSAWCRSSKLPVNLARRQRNFDLLSEFLRPADDVFVLPRSRPEVETGWHMFPIMIRPESGVRRAEFQQHMEAPGHRHPHGVDRQRHPAARVRRHAAPGRTAVVSPTPTG